MTRLNDIPPMTCAAGSNAGMKLILYASSCKNKDVEVILTGLVHRWERSVARHEEVQNIYVNLSIHSIPYPCTLNSIFFTNKYFLYNLQTLSVVFQIVPRSSNLLYNGK